MIEFSLYSNSSGTQTLGESHTIPVILKILILLFWFNHKANFR